MQTVAFVVYEGFQSMTLAAEPVFEYANKVAGQTVYKTVVLSEKGGLVKSSGSMAVDSQPFDDTVLDTVIVGGSDPVAQRAPEAVLDFIRRSEQTSRRTASICSGAFVLAQAGLLDGRRATTHWGYARELKKRFPTIQVDEDRIFVIDGAVWSSAGMTAGMDLALAMVEQDLGADVSRRVAQLMVMYHRRAGGQSQHSALLELAPKSDRIQKALTYAREHLDEPLSVEQLAEVASLSPRQFSRAFRAETGESPAKAVENLRLEAARLLLERSRHSIDQIAVQSGFTDGRRMREVFLRVFGVPPQTVRHVARA